MWSIHLTISSAPDDDLLGDVTLLSGEVRLHGEPTTTRVVHSTSAEWLSDLFALALQLAGSVTRASDGASG